MKKVILAAVLVMTICFGASAQRDGFFAGDNGGDISRASGDLPLLPKGGVGTENGDQPATPLGSGLLVLTVLGAGYALAKKR